MNPDFEELSHDTEVIARLTQFRDATMRIEEVMRRAVDPNLYDKLSANEKIKYNLLMSYSLNSMFWMYLRTEGMDPAKHKIKTENDRLKKAMMRAKQIHDRNTLMPRLKKDVAQRFVRSGLWDPKENKKRSIEEVEKSESSST